MNDIIWKWLPAYELVFGLYISPPKEACGVTRALIEPETKMYDFDTAVTCATRL